ncbi:condensation domain-containing protein [Pseudomonas sp. NA13]
MNNIEDIYSLSPTQHGLLFHSVYEPDSRVYYQQLSLDMNGPLQLNAFRGAWQALMQRHAVLRSAFCGKNWTMPIRWCSRKSRCP